MARIRAIKPGFFQNEALAEFSHAHRLLFAGLWTIADREGRLEDRPRRIKAAIFPYDDLDVDAMLSDLAKGRDSLIVRYVVDGVGYVWVRKFLEHQRPHHTEPASSYPALVQDVAPAPDLSGAEPCAHCLAPLGREGKGKGNEEGKGDGAARQSAPADLSDAWNTLKAHEQPACLELSDKRKRAAQMRLRERPLDDWRRVIESIARSDFCRGQNDRGWVATFDWLVQPDTATKVLEGKYDNRARPVPINRAPDPRAREDDDWFEVCERLHGGNCGGRLKHSRRMESDSLRATS